MSVFETKDRGPKTLKREPRDLEPTLFEERLNEVLLGILQFVRNNFFQDDGLIFNQLLYKMCPGTPEYLWLIAQGLFPVEPFFTLFRKIFLTVESYLDSSRYF